MTEKTFTQEEVNYILELMLIQGELFSEVSNKKGYDLHDFGDLVVSVRESETVMKAWHEDDGTNYPYWSDLFNDTDLIKKAILEVDAK